MVLPELVEGERISEGRSITDALSVDFPLFFLEIAVETEKRVLRVNFTDYDHLYI
jgi:hypothetical protein